jgi:phosphatidylserine decarboxylase precursor
MLLDYVKTLPQWLLPKRLLTVLLGLGASSTAWPRFSRFVMAQFIRRYQVNMDEALHPDLMHYASFNDFFIRELKPGCRPKAAAPLISPVDGVISQMGAITAGRLMQAKGKTYTLQALLGVPETEVAPWVGGTFMTLYLAPKDYHRIHMPIAGRVVKTQYLPGKLFSVQPLTTRVIPQLFAQNERVAVWFETALGPMVMVLVGATIVGKIATTWHGEFTRQSQPQNV